MRKHLFFGRGRFVHKQHLQQAMHSGVMPFFLAHKKHRLADMPPKPAAVQSGGMAKKKLMPLKFRI